MVGRLNRTDTSLSPRRNGPDGRRRQSILATSDGQYAQNVRAALWWIRIELGQPSVWPPGNLHGRLNRRGRFWQSRFYSCVLDNHHFLTALACFDLNPVRAPMVDRAEEYEWSSAAAHGGLKGAPDWLDQAALRSRVMPAEWRERLPQPQSRGEVAALRRATQTECPLGQPGFVEELEAKFAVCLRPLPPGRPPKKSTQSEVAPAEIARHAGQPA